MKKKLNLKELKVNSFITELKKEKEEKVKGGRGTYVNCYNVSATCP